MWSRARESKAFDRYVLSRDNRNPINILDIGCARAKASDEFNETLSLSSRKILGAIELSDIAVISPMETFFAYPGGLNNSQISSLYNIVFLRNDIIYNNGYFLITRKR